jgi:c-di-GMP-binding flagellar brake protein YcgR
MLVSRHVLVNNVRQLFLLGSKGDMLPSLTDDQIEDRFFLLGRMEILQVLNELIHRRDPVTVYFNGGREFFQTTLLEATPEALVFDLSGDGEANRRLPASPGCVFVSHLNGIRVQFAGARSERFSWGGSDAFWVPLPERVVRVQRRESYRILLPVAKPLMLKVYAEEGKAFVEWPAHDLSVGGIGLTVTGETQLEVGLDIARIVLALPKQRSIDCMAQVRHVTHLGERADGNRYRVGLAFLNLPAQVGVAIQRYITKIEHQRRGLDKGSFTN